MVKSFKLKPENQTCAVCLFNFGREFGDHGKGYIEAHHIVPLAHSNEVRAVREEDFVALCANCHRMAHLKFNGTEELPTVEQLRAIREASRQ